MESQDFSDDSELVKGCLAGSEEAWSSFYLQYQGLIHGVIQDTLPFSSKEDREDVYQETYRRLLKAFEQFDPKRGGLKPLVNTVAKYSSIAWLRYKTTQSRKSVQVPVDHHGGGDENAVAVESKVESQERQLLKAEMRVAIKLLKEPCPELLTMRFYDELRDKEIAEILGMKENTVTSHIRDCKAQLRAMVVEFAAEGVGL